MKYILRLLFPARMLQALGSDRVSAREVTVYGVVVVVGLIVHLFFYALVLSNSSVAIAGVVFFVLELGLSYVVNALGDKTAFVKRFMSLSVALIVPLFLLSFSTALVLQIIADVWELSPVLYHVTTSEVVFAVLFEMVYLLWLLILMRRVSKP